LLGITGLDLKDLEKSEPHMETLRKLVEGKQVLAFDYIYDALIREDYLRRERGPYGADVYVPTEKGILRVRGTQ
jgi:hypothetical protein